MYKNKKYLHAFTIIELIIVVSIMVILASIVVVTSNSIQKSSRDSARDAQAHVIAASLEKYYRDNGEYPSVATMTSSNVDILQQKLGVSSASVFKFPLANTSVANSISAGSPSISTLVYSANTSDLTKNNQCQTDPSGYCDGFTLAYVKEVNGVTQTIQSLHSTFEALKTECDNGDTQSGTTCTHTYAGTYHAGSYTCPSGGTLNESTCIRTYAATYMPAGGGYYCPSGGTLTNSNGWWCVVTYTPSSTQSCPSGYSGPSGGTCTQTQTFTDTQSCPSGWTKISTTWNEQTSTYSTSCRRTTPPTTSYNCPSGGSLTTDNSSCIYWYSASYYSYSAYYYCNGSDTLNGSTCTNTYVATQSPGYYTCPNGGVANGSTCSYTYQLRS